MANGEAPSMYEHGAIAMSAARLAEWPLSASLSGLLLTSGLPDLTAETAVLGLIFTDPRLVSSAEGSGGRYLTIGFEVWDPEESTIAIDLRNDSVVARQTSDGAVVFINSDLSSLISFLAVFRDFLSAARRDDEPTVMTAVEARERLAAMKRGEISRAAPRRPAFDRRTALAAMRKTFTAIDGKALRRNRWWTLILEQAADEQL